MNKRIIWVLVAAALTISSIPAVANELDALEQQKNSIEAQKNNVSQQKAAEQNKKAAAQKEVTNLANAQNKAQGDLQKISGDLNNINNDIKNLDQAIKEAEDKYNQQRELFKTRVRLMYENSGTSPVKAFVEAKSMSDFLAKIELMSLIAKKDKDLVQSLDASKKDVEYKKKLKEDEKLAKERQEADQKKVITTLQVSRAQKDQEISAINSRLNQLEREENELNRKSEEIANWIRSLKSKRKGGYAGGNMTWPVPSSGNVTSPFGNRLHPVLKQNRMHTGIDIAAPNGVSIVAANTGTVIFSGWQDGYGNTVILDHGGEITTLYAHCSRLLVKSGQDVAAGEVIAKVGSTGLSTGPHLHFEVRKNGEPVDPLDYVSP